MGTRNALAIDLGRRRLRAVQVSPGGKRSLRVRRVVVSDVPSNLNIEDAAEMGAWLAGQLREARFSGGQATLSVGREHVIVKRITLPTVEAAELPDMTRLAMQRELPFDAESAIIDFMPVERHETSTTVLAVAVPRKQVEFVQQVAQAANLKVHRIALRTIGTVALVNTIALPSAASVRVEDVGLVAEERTPPTGEAGAAAAAAAPATLAVDVVGEGVEFCVLADGSVRFSRAAEVPAPQDALAMAEAVVTEARRTWMSYRSGDDIGGIGQAIIMGDRRIAEYAANPVGEMLRMPVRVMHEHPRIDANGNDLSRVWPLLGLLLESETASERIDFLHPRKAPDLGAQKRQRRLLAAATVVIVGGAAFTLMRRDLQTLQESATTLAAQTKAGDGDYARHYRETFRVKHLNTWDSVHVNWLEHAMFLAQVAPPPDQIVLDSWAGTLEASDIKYERDGDRWRASHQATIVIDGEARNRATADAFRGALIQNTIYVASTTGADARGGKRMPYGFTYRLRTRAADPPSGDVAPPESADSPPPADAAAHQQNVDRLPSSGDMAANVGGEQ